MNYLDTSFVKHCSKLLAFCIHPCMVTLDTQVSITLALNLVFLTSLIVDVSPLFL